MRFFIFFILFALSVSFNACSQNVAPKREEINEENDWSGSASYISRTVSGSSSHAQYVSTESESFSEYRMDATLSRGHGHSGSSMVIKERFRHTGRTSGSAVVSETITNGNATGNMETDITVEITDDGTSYSFFIPIPACRGKKTVTKTDGSSIESDMGEDETMIHVEFQPMGKNPNVLSGEIKDRRTNDNGEMFETVLSWSFVKGPLDVELLISPENYASWMPEPGKDESTPGSQMNIGLKLQSKNGEQPKLKAKSFELRLINTSSEPGIAINYPATTTLVSKPDLRFIGEGSGQEGQELIIHPSNGTSASTVLASYDGGGHTILQAEAVLEGGIRIRGMLEVSGGPVDIPVPKRKEGSRIAEVWLRNNGDPAENADNETSRGNNNNGDGLTAYEEYRGIFSGGRFKRLDPRVKELGVQVNKEIEKEFQSGLDLFTNASGVAVIKLYDDELGADRILNRNRGINPGSVQHALQLLDVRLEKEVVGRNEPETESGKTPRQSQRTVIDLQKIKKMYAEQEAEVHKANEQMPYSVQDEIANTVAHELAHGVFVTHHGPNSVVIPRTAVRDHKPPFELYGSDGSLLKIPDTGKVMKLVGDNKGNESSGDLNCIIAYTSRYQWYFEQAPDRTLVYRAVPLLIPGTIFCTSGEGTGINANGYFGNSAKGNCLSRIKVKDN